jgi:hypothetical protein
LIVRPFEPLDLERIRPWRPIPAPMRQAAAALPQAGPCWTAAHDGAVLACAGLVLHWPGRAGTWCLIGRDLPTRAWPWLHKRVARGLAELRHELALRRIEAEALTGWEPGARWLHRLGFRPEGIMPAYGHDGADYDRWALTGGSGTGASTGER